MQKNLFQKINRIFNRIMNSKENNQEMNSDNQENFSDIQTNESSISEQNNDEENNKEEKKDSLQEKVDELNDRYLRLYSEFDNYKKRTGKERIDLIKTAGIEIITEMIPVLDDLDRAVKSNEKLEDIEAIKNGIKLIHNKLANTLSKKGLEPLEAIGQVFDAEYHEAITNIAAPSEDLKGKVIDEVERGYLLNGKVIRYSKVIVGN
jgi:molecular chaperone GrpE